MTKFVVYIKDGTYAEKGYKSKFGTYGMSKVGLSALTRIHQEEFNEKPDSDIIINHINPGYVDTDMTSGKGHSTVDEGARSSIHAALLPPGSDIKGKFLNNDCTEIDWTTYEMKM
jgi:carbonyl reductase 1